MRFTIAAPVRKRNALVSQRRWQQISKAITIVLFILPAMLLFLTFVIFPIAQASRYSLYNWNGLGDLTDYFGLKNYQLLFTDLIFRTALKNSVTIALLSITIQLPISLALAVLTNRKMPGRTFFRLVFFVPFIISEAVAGLIFRFIYNPTYGAPASILRLLHSSSTPPAWLADTHTVLFAIFGVMIWKYFGFHYVLYLAGLQNIPHELNEAARIDGANDWQTLRYVTLPLLGSTIRLSLFLSILGSLQYFDLVYIISAGGPANASQTMATYLYQYGFQQFALGYGSAVAIVMFIICLIFALLYQRVVMRQDLVGTSAM